VDPTAEAPLTAFYAEFTGEPTDYPTVLREKKLQVLQSSLNSDVIRLTAIWQSICRGDWRYRDYTWHELQEVLREVVADLPIYRTYVRTEENPGGSVRPDDRKYIEAAITAAREHLPPADGDLLDFLRALLMLEVRGGLEASFVLRFQQLTGPAMAKGAEDTAFYCFNRLVSLNEVGGDPGRFGVSVADFHAACAETQRHWPQTMLASSTHDTKRSEDVRARINLLSEIPERWCEAVQRWSERTQRHWREETTTGIPDRNAVYHFYQTLVGAWPLSTERAWAYMEKAIREAKVHTSWTDPNPEYEQAMQAFVEGVLADAEFTAELEAFVAALREPWYVSALAQTLLKLAAPGVPDTYQGTELWDLSLVDPDNRRPVDYDLRRRLLAELEGMVPEAIWVRRAEGLPKLYVIRQALALRARRPEFFGLRAGYTPLEARGAKAGHVVAFARGAGVVAVAPRLVMGLGGEWGDTAIELPAGRWRDELTGDTLEIGEGGTIGLGELLRRFPVALLAREDAAV
jgi:(1->4)-alpha-D-glucan 1-alpha-D-glucosylmutase